jgi:hypothetical protein
MIYCYKCSILLSVIFANLLVCLICKLNFIIHMYRKKHSWGFGPLLVVMEQIPQG